MESEPATAPKVKRWPLGVLTILVVSVTAVAVVLLRDDAPDDEPGGITVPGFGVSAGSQAPDFSIELLDGGRFTLSDHLANDGRPVLLNLWASWCRPCRAEMPHLDAAAQAHPGVYFLGVAIDDDPAAARDFAVEVDVGYSLAVDEADRVARRYPPFGLPVTYLIGSDGLIVRVIYGEMTEPQIETLLAEVDS